jgi:ketosteroid isomerase-like protein
MKKVGMILLLLLYLNSFAQQAPTKDMESVKHVLSTQQAAWNDGDIDGFMHGYWKNDSLTFIGKGGITKGWQQTLNNYKKSYPDKATMGQLTFEILSVEEFSPTTIHVIGKWNLKRETPKGDLGGCFTLVFKKIKNQWVIVSDHTS